MTYFCVFKRSLFRGQNLLKPRPDWSPLGVKFKISDEHPRLFHMVVPPGLLNHCIDACIKLSATHPYSVPGRVVKYELENSIR